MKKSVSKKTKRAVVVEKEKGFPTDPREIQTMKEDYATKIIELMAKNEELKAKRATLKAGSSSLLNQAIENEK
jgi:hypothetical protein